MGDLREEITKLFYKVVISLHASLTLATIYCAIVVFMGSFWIGLIVSLLASINIVILIYLIVLYRKEFKKVLANDSKS